MGRIETGQKEEISGNTGIKAITNLFKLSAGNCCSELLRLMVIVCNFVLIGIAWSYFHNLQICFETKVECEIALTTIGNLKFQHFCN